MPLTLETVLNRPAEIESLINEKFVVNASLSRTNPDAPNHHYRSFGKKEYAYRGKYHTISSTLLFLAYSKLKKQFDVLDIGTGNGDLLHFINRRFPHIQAIGLSAREMRENTHIPDHQYILGNAENLMKVSFINIKKFACIVSFNTFLHFLDPLGAIIEAYETLEDGGILMIDNFSLPGLKDLGERLFSYLRSQGYQVDSSGAYDYDIGCIFIRKTIPHLIFPVSYAFNDGAFLYTADQELLNFDDNNSLYWDREKYIKEFLNSTIPLHSVANAFDAFDRIEELVAEIVIIANQLIEKKHLVEVFPEQTKMINALALFVSYEKNKQMRLMRCIAEKNAISPHLNYTETNVTFDVNFLAEVIGEIERDYEISQMFNNHNTLFAHNSTPQPSGALSAAQLLEQTPPHQPSFN